LSGYDVDWARRATTRPRALAPARHVLLISASADEREQYAEALRQSGYSTLQASRSEDACRLAFELRPIAIIADIDLQDSDDGARLVTRLKRDRRLRSAPTVLLTPEPIAEAAEGTMRAMCDVLVLKPCPPDELAQMVDGLVARWRAARPGQRG
jgi:two-component system OmpR family response regulator